MTSELFVALTITTYNYNYNIYTYSIVGYLHILCITSKPDLAFRCKIMNYGTG